MQIIVEVMRRGIYAEAFGYEGMVERAGGDVPDHPAGKRWAHHRDGFEQVLYAGPLVFTWSRKADHPDAIRSAAWHRKQAAIDAAEAAEVAEAQRT